MNWTCEEIKYIMTVFNKHLKNQKTTRQKKLMNYGHRKLVNIEVILMPKRSLMLEEIP